MKIIITDTNYLFCFLFPLTVSDILRWKGDEGESCVFALNLSNIFSPWSSVSAFPNLQGVNTGQVCVSGGDAFSDWFMIMKEGEISLRLCWSKPPLWTPWPFFFTSSAKVGLNWKSVGFVVRLKIPDLASTGVWWVQVLKINFQGYHGRRTEMNLGGPN